MTQEVKVFVCPYCGKKHSRNNKKPFTRRALEAHIEDAHFGFFLPPISVYEFVDSIAGDEPDGVYWGIVHEYTGEK